MKKRLGTSKKHSSARTPQQGELWSDPVTGMVFVWVVGGLFEMGDLFEDGALNESQNRVYAMSAAHELLYQSESLSEVAWVAFVYSAAKTWYLYLQP